MQQLIHVYSWDLKPAWQYQATLLQSQRLESNSCYYHSQASKNSVYKNQVYVCDRYSYGGDINLILIQGLWVKLHGYEYNYSKAMEGYICRSS